jgi:RsiW-degrading membrane proteinase PrsW (M82 family)
LIVKLEVSIPLHSPNKKELAFFLLSGVIIGIPVNIYLHNTAVDIIKGVPPFYLLIISELILAPLIEEFSKMFAYLNRHGETEQSIFRLAVLGGLGFGIAEFLILTFDRGVFFLFNFPGIFFHASAVAITGYGLATHQTLRYYLLAVLLHFLHNFFLFFLTPTNLLVNIVAVAFSVFIVVATYLIASKLQIKTKNQFID